MARYSIVIATLLLVIFGTGTLRAQEAPSPSSGGGGWAVGARIDGLLAVPSASFTELPGVANCLTLDSGRFESGSGGGFGIAAVVALRPDATRGIPSGLGMSLRVGFASTTTTFETEATIGRASDRSGNLVPIVDRYRIEVTTSEIGFEPTLDMQFSPTVPLMASVGLRTGIIVGGEYSQSEELVSPDAATFTDGSTLRGSSSGDLQEIESLQLGLVASIGYEFALSPLVIVKPTLSGLLALGSPIKGIDWKGNELRLGISLLYIVVPASSTPLDGK